VNTGIVVAGTVGAAGRLEYTVVGDAVNIAQRLQSQAVGGEILASTSTVEAAGDPDGCEQRSQVPDARTRVRNLGRASCLLSY